MFVCGAQVALEEGTRLFREQSCFAELDLRLVFYHQLGYLLSLASAVPSVDERLRTGAVPGADYEFSSQGYTDGEMRYFYRNETTRNLDNKFGDIFGAILDLESELFTELTDGVLLNGTLLFSLSALSAQLDCLIALTVPTRSMLHVS